MLRKLSNLAWSILTLQDNAHSIALGTAIGLFIAWTPTVGIHMVLVIGICLMLRANKVAGLIAVYLSNPITMVPMYWFAYWVGSRILDQELTYAELRSILNYQGWDGLKAAFWRICVEFAGPMWLGGLLLAIVHAIPGYYAARWAIERYRGTGTNMPMAVGPQPTSADRSSSPHQQPRND